MLFDSLYQALAILATSYNAYQHDRDFARRVNISAERRRQRKDIKAEADLPS
jgi:hypothetical protein